MAANKTPQVRVIKKQYTRKEVLESLVYELKPFVIAATGYQPNLPFLEKLGVALCDNSNRTPVYSDDTHETNIEGIYLAGVICGGMDTHSLFIENSREHAVKIVRDIQRRQTKP